MLIGISFCILTSFIYNHPAQLQKYRTILLQKRKLKEAREERKDDNYSILQV